MIVKHDNKDLFIVHISMDITWALVTYDKEKLSGIFKIDMDNLNFNKKQSAYISKINSESFK